MEARETPRMHKYGESKTTRIMMATLRHVTSSWGIIKFQVVDFFFEQRVHISYSVAKGSSQAWGIQKILLEWS